MFLSAFRKVPATIMTIEETGYNQNHHFDGDAGRDDETYLFYDHVIYSCLPVSHVRSASFSFADFSCAK